jgi:DNA-binding NarL/FixJ family response regulator
MSRGPQLKGVKLTVQENNQLVEWTRRHKTSQALALRSRIVLACAQGADNSEVARRCRVTRQTVGKWRSRFVERSCVAPSDRLRSARRTVDCWPL